MTCGFRTLRPILVLSVVTRSGAADASEGEDPDDPDRPKAWKIPARQFRRLVPADLPTMTTTA